MDSKLTIQVQIEEGCEDLPLPSYQTPGSSGMDLVAAVREDVIIPSGTHILIPTGLRISIPPGYEGQVRARSGLALKNGLGVMNGPGTIDSDYRGEIGVILFNFGPGPFTVRRGDRIAQLVFSRVEQASLVPVSRLDDSCRSSGGFGSTGH